MQNPRWKDWLAQAERDLEWAKASLHSGFFAQTCFVCQQVGEKSLKALAFFRGADS
ncbi:putative toxin-antitoxin system, antitoxin component [Leptospira borgpetersenii str. Brem 307]|uniref:Toxin-antitoxin system, antitoxin component n=1 Tax=Leptospira borgpetersenii str. Brem 328 TaxID=1049780 RepID=A0ABC9SKR8_LEPBO|nr:putative toxin-antitoxin system, antitoxin component [Leptospira borgpetersenii str. Brem 307]EMN18424.1 putative toxin-antitoxin system, antitoxin component [Leptospira borgpetersenii str. Brem 328]